MMPHTDDARPADGSAEAPSPTDYQAPRVERVLTPAELEREILYAGDEPSGPQP
jgi:hypothetical protein